MIGCRSQWAMSPRNVAAITATPMSSSNPCMDEIVRHDRGFGNFATSE
jgi:hypothetical protein